MKEGDSRITPDIIYSEPIEGDPMSSAPQETPREPLQNESTGGNFVDSAILLSRYCSAFFSLVLIFCFLFCIALCCFVLFCFVLFCFVLFCFVLFCFVLFCFVLFCFVLFCFVLFCFVLFCIFLYFFCFNTWLIRLEKSENGRRQAALEAHRATEELHK